MPNGFLPTDQESPKPSPVEQATVVAEEESSVKMDEKTIEQLPESRDTFLEKPAEDEAAPQEAAVQAAAEAPTAGAAPVQKDEVTIAVEKILEEGLGDYFNDLPPDAKARFLKKGEEVSGEVAGMVRSFRVNVKKVLKLIRDWLLTIPGVNKFFLEQEAKLKADQVLGLQQERREGANKLP